MGRFLSHAAWLALQSLILLFVSLATTTNASAASEKIGQAGDYVLFLDSEGRPVAGTYWLSPQLRGSAYASLPGGTPSNMLYTDREFFPTRMISPVHLTNAILEYSADPFSADVGQSIDIVEKRRQVGMLADAIPPRETHFKLTVFGKIASTIKDYTLTSLVYETREDASDPPGKKGRRVYVEPFGMDLSADVAARVATLETGQAASTGDFHAIFTERANTVPSYSACIGEKRRTEEYKTAVKREREIVDDPLAKGFPAEETGWWESDPEAIGKMVEFLLMDLCAPKP